MRQIVLGMAMFTMLSLTACVYEDYDHHPNGRPFEHGSFCPPGQAKKGNCGYRD